MLTFFVAMIDGRLALIAGSGMLLAIYFRGYLIPGTPVITKRYFPDWFLRYFDGHDPDAAEAYFDPQEYLLGAGVIVEAEQSGDIELDTRFEEVWRGKYDDVHAHQIDEDLLSTLIDIEPDRLQIDWHSTGFDVFVDTQWIGQWESRVAFRADVAANAVIGKTYQDWERLPLAYRSNVLGVLRFFVTRCPACNGPVVIETDTQQSCCREIDVIATTCRGCGVRLFEAPYDPDVLAELDPGGSSDSALS